VKSLLRQLVSRRMIGPEDSLVQEIRAKAATCAWGGDFLS